MLLIHSRLLVENTSEFIARNRLLISTLTKECSTTQARYCFKFNVCVQIYTIQGVRLALLALLLVNNSFSGDNHVM